MSTNEEIRDYLDYVLDHEGQCHREDCAVCNSAQNVYESIRKLIFSGAMYPQVTITARRGIGETAARPAASARKASARKAA